MRSKIINNIINNKYYMYKDNIYNICYDKYYNELILLNSPINLKNVNYSKNKFIIKKIIEDDNFKNLNKIYNYNLFENLCIFGNYRMVKWLYLKFKFDNTIIFLVIIKLYILMKIFVMHLLKNLFIIL